jgi:hypothetical protein
MIDNTKNLNYDLCERNVYYISFLFSKQLYLYEIKNIFENQRFNFTFENTKYFLQRALVIFTIISIFILSRKIFLEGFLFAKK